MTMRLSHHEIPSAIIAALALGCPTAALADSSTIKRPGAHPHYVFELEPHFLLGFVDPPGVGTGTGYGPGFRGTIEILDNGPIQKINNTMGIGFGVDWVHYNQGGRCGDDPFCDDTAVDHYYFPLVLQWNFWLSQNWSVFGEPGVAFRASPDTEDKFDTFVIAGGARLHFGDHVALTLRAGLPTISAGVSFFF
jgi:hypothetical protein